MIVTNSVTFPRAVSGWTPRNTSSLGVHPGGIHHSNSILFHPTQNLRQLRNRIGTKDKIQEWNPLQQPILFLLSDAARHSQKGAPGHFHCPIPSERRKHFFFRFLPDRAGIDDDQIGILISGSRNVVKSSQHLADPKRVADVHLTAKSVNEVALLKSHYRRAIYATRLPQARIGAPAQARVTLKLSNACRQYLLSRL